MSQKTIKASERPYPKLTREEFKRIAKAVKRTQEQDRVAKSPTPSTTPQEPEQTENPIADRIAQRFLANLNAAAVAGKSFN